MPTPVKFRSSDGYIIETNSDIIACSEVMTVAIKHTAHRTDHIFHLPDITSTVLKLLLEWLRESKTDKDYYEMFIWQKKFWGMDLVTKIEMVKAARYFRMRTLFDEARMFIRLSNRLKEEICEKYVMEDILCWDKDPTSLILSSANVNENYLGLINGPTDDFQEIGLTVGDIVYTEDEEE